MKTARLLVLFSLTYRKLLIVLAMTGHAYGLPLPALKMVQVYLLNQKEGTKAGFSYITWENIISGGPQGSILVPLLFNMFLLDLFLEHKDCSFTNYADDTTPYVVASNTGEVIILLLLLRNFLLGLPTIK